MLLDLAPIDPKPVATKMEGSGSVAGTGSVAGSRSIPPTDPDGPKPCGSCKSESGSGSPTLLYTR